MRRVLSWVAVLIGGLIGLSMLGLQALGMSPTSYLPILQWAQGSVLLACSGRYLSGFDEAQIRDDLASYSPATDCSPLGLTMRKVELLQTSGFSKPRLLFGGAWLYLDGRFRSGRCRPLIA